MADGVRIRMVDLNTGLISTLAGKTSSHWGEDLTGTKPVCTGWMPASPNHGFDWPTDVALNPVDGRLHVLDGGDVVVVSESGQVRINCMISDRLNYGLLKSFKKVSGLASEWGSIAQWIAVSLLTQRPRV